MLTSSCFLDGTNQTLCGIHRAYHLSLRIAAYVTISARISLRIHPIPKHSCFGASDIVRRLPGMPLPLEVWRCRGTELCESLRSTSDAKFCLLMSRRLAVRRGLTLVAASMFRFDGLIKNHSCFSVNNNSCYCGCFGFMWLLINGIYFLCRCGMLKKTSKRAA